MLPKGFLSHHPYFKFKQLEKIDDLQILKKYKERYREVSFNYLYLVRPEHIIERKCEPIQIPTILHEDINYQPKNASYDIDVLEYLMTASLINPSIEERHISKIRRDVKEVQEIIATQYNCEFAPIDDLSIAKLAQTICRLELKRKLEDPAFNRARRDFKELIEQLFDIKASLIGEFGGTTWARPMVSTQYSMLNLTKDDLAVYKVIKRRYEETKTWVPLHEIREGCKHLKNILENLHNLHNYGWIYYQKNFTEFKPTYLRDDYFIEE